jgi:hypothetical protein
MQLPWPCLQSDIQHTSQINFYSVFVAVSYFLVWITAECARIVLLVAGCRWPSIAYFCRKVAFLPFGWRLNKNSYRLWQDLTFLVVVGIGQSLNGICWHDLWSSSTWSETCIYLHQASWVRRSIFRCSTSGFWRQTRCCTGRTIKAWDIISLHLPWGFVLI